MKIVLRTFMQNSSLMAVRIVISIISWFLKNTIKTKDIKSLRTIRKHKTDPSTSSNTFEYTFSDSSLYAHYVFKAFDVNCNGAISFRVSDSKDLLRMSFEITMLNVSSKDLLVTLSTLLRGSVYERLRWTFKLYDLNGDGCISRSELGEVVQAVHELMGRRPNQPEDDRKARDQVDRVFRKLDLNQDGVITIEEFLEACLKDDLVTRSLQMFDTGLWWPPEEIVISNKNKDSISLIDL